MERYNLEGSPIPMHMPAPPALKPDAFRAAAAGGIPIIYTRAPPAFGGAHIEGADSLPPSRLSNAGRVAPVEKEVLLVVDDPRALDFAVRNLYRMGYTSFSGYLEGGIEGWYKGGNPIPGGSADVPAAQYAHKVGRTAGDRGRSQDSEWDEGHIEEATHIYLGRLPERLGEIPQESPSFSSARRDTLELRCEHPPKAGRTRVCNLLGGIDSWKSAWVPAGESEVTPFTASSYCEFRTVVRLRT